MRIGSVAQTIILTSFAFFLSSELGSASGAPLDDLRFGIGSYGDNIMERWLQPCGTPVSGVMKKVQQRHSVHRTLKRVRTQLRVAQNHFRLDLNGMHEIYSKVYKVLKKQYRMSWLPEKQLEWYHKELWCLEKGKKAERALPRLHDSLQRFAITFHHLREFRLKSDINVDHTMEKRNSIINGMYNEILRALCEVETAIQNLGLSFPTTHTTRIVTESSHWAKQGDLTLMLIQDWGVLRLYQTFLNDWMRAFRNATATGPGTCDPNTIEPLDVRPKKPKKVLNEKVRELRKIRKQASRLARKHHFGPGQNSNFPQRPRRRFSRRRQMRNQQKKAM